MIPATANWLAANAPRKKTLVHVVTIQGYARVFTNVKTGVAGEFAWLQKIEALAQAAEPIQGGSLITELKLTVLDVGRAITADIANLVPANWTAVSGLTPGIFDGRQITITSGMTTLNLRSDFLPIATLIIDQVDHDQQNNAYTFHLRSLMVNVFKQKVFNFGDDNQTGTSSQNPKNFYANPMDALLTVLQSQLALPNSAINLTAINALKAGLFAGMQMRFVITQPVEAKQWLDLEIFRAFAGWNFINYAGQYTPVYELPSAAPVSQLTITDKLTSGSDDAGENPIEPEEIAFINEIQYGLDHDGGNFRTFLTELSAASFARYRLTGVLVIQPRGVRSLYGGYAFGRMVSNVFFKRYAFKNLKYTLTAYWDAAPLEIGDLVRLTSASVPDRTKGELGITNRLCEVLSTKKNLERGLVELELLDQSWLDALGAFQIAPDGTPVWTAASAQQKSTYMFVSRGGTQSDGTPGHALL